MQSSKEQQGENKTAFFNDQCIEIEERLERDRNRIRKTRDPFKKIRDIKGAFHAKMGTIKDGNGMDLKEAEDVKKRLQEYTEELYKKDLHERDKHNGVITTQGQTSWNVKSSWLQEASL